ncbi:MAG: hypothetical protein QRY16_20035 [Enterobacterales bacterium endosymbiont of Blomia tropicalis]|nr:hypothetical protein [Mixta mediterraneensis]MDL4915970.1 hypothetical protein [Mixta mediterraneensis]
MLTERLSECSRPLILTHTINNEQHLRTKLLPGLASSPKEYAS